MVLGWTTSRSLIASIIGGRKPWRRSPRLLKSAHSGLGAPTLLVVGDTDFVRVEHAAEMQQLIPGAQLAVFPATAHVGLMQRACLPRPV